MENLDLENCSPFSWTMVTDLSNWVTNSSRNTRLKMADNLWLDAAMIVDQKVGN